MITSLVGFVRLTVRISVTTHVYEFISYYQKVLSLSLSLSVSLSVSVSVVYI